MHSWSYNMMVELALFDLPESGVAAAAADEKNAFRTHVTRAVDVSRCSSFILYFTDGAPHECV